VNTDAKTYRGTNDAKALRKPSESPDPLLKGFLESLAAMAAKQLLLELDAAEPETTEKNA
jgi:hypothetical protein